MNKYMEFERNLKIAYLLYETNKLDETLNYLDKMVELILKDDKILEGDPFWIKISHDVFKSIVLNNFYNRIELTINDLNSLFRNKGKIIKNTKEFCDNFRNNELITFVEHIENISDNILENITKILIDNIEKIKLPDDKVELPKIVVVEYVKKICPFIYKKYENNTLDKYSIPRKDFRICVDGTFINIINCYDALKFLGKTPLLKNSIPMCTQSYQVDQDTTECNTWQLDSFDTELAGLWIKVLREDCEYEIHTDTASSMEQKKFNLNQGYYFSIIVKEKWINNTDNVLINNIFNCIVDYLEYQHNNKIQNFVEELHKKYKASYDEILNFFQKLSNHQDISQEFFKELITNNSYCFTYDNLLVSRKGLTAKTFYKKYNLSYFESYQCLVQLAESISK